MTNVCSGLSVRGTFDGEVSTPEKSVTLVEKSPILLADHTPFTLESAQTMVHYKQWKDYANFSTIRLPRPIVVVIYEGVS